MVKFRWEPIIRRHSSSICAPTSTNVLAWHFKVKYDQHFVQRVGWSGLTLNCYKYKTKRTLRSFFAEVREKLSSRVSKLFTVFVKMRF